MAFTCIATIDYFADELFTHTAQVIQFNGKKPEMYVNLRVFSKGAPIPKGVCLLKDEFIKLLPYLEKREPINFGTDRIVTFLKSQTIYAIVLSKPNFTNQFMDFTEKELEGLLAIKERIIEKLSV